MEIEPENGDPKTKSHLIFLGLDKEFQFDAHCTPLEDSYVNGQNIFFSRDIKDVQDYIFGSDVIKP